MKSVFEIISAKWLSNPQTIAVMRAIGGFDDSPLSLFVGGCVRDSVLAEISENANEKRDFPDIDIATKLEPSDVISRLERADIRYLLSGIEHGTVTALSEGYSFEITTLRYDIETDGRYAVITSADSWEEDAKRRDFTVNTLLADINGNVFDPLGCGLADIKSRNLVFVGDPKARIKEDYLRILRFFRFHAVLGNKEITDHKALQCYEREKHNLLKLSGERITGEFIKTLKVANPSYTLSLMHKIGISDLLIQNEFDYDSFNKFCNLQNDYREISLAGRLHLFIGINSKEKIKQSRLVLSKKMISEIYEIENAVKFLSECNKKEDILKNLKILAYRYSKTSAIQAFFAISSKNPNIEQGFISDIAGSLKDFEIPELPINGNDLINMGVTGKKLGEILKKVENYWIAEEFKPDRDLCLSFAERIINQDNRAQLQY